MDLKVGRIYQLQQKIGSGSFGEIYKAINLKNQELYAVKLEPVNTKQPQLHFESKLYHYLNSDDKIQEKGIPRIYLTTVEGDYNILIMDLLGKSLENLFEANARKFSLKTVLQFGIQAIQRIEFLHSKFFLHRDLKPDNFLIGRGDKAHMIYMIDFGLSKKYITRDNRHIPYRENKNLTGTARYASVNTHLGIEQSRRDDLESLGYIMVGVLPWMNQPGANQKEKYDNITKKKASTSEEVLCSNLPEEFTTYIKYCKRLKFEEKPDYALLKRLFRDLLQKQGFEEDFRYDWNQYDKTVYSQKSTKGKGEQNYLPRLNNQNNTEFREIQQQKTMNSHILVQNDQIIAQMRNYNDFQNNIRKKSLMQQNKQIK